MMFRLQQRCLQRLGHQALQAATLVVFATAFAAVFAFCAPRAHAEERIVVDLSRYDVPVSTGFSGARLLLFGASPRGDSEAESFESDILIKVRGPLQSYTMSRKQRVFGLWMDSARWQISSAPAFFQILTSQNDDNWFEDFERRRNAFSFRDLSLPLSSAQPQDVESSEKQQENQEAKQETRQEDQQAFRSAFLRHQVSKGLYGELPNSIERLGNNLFRVSLTLPPGLPTGTYIVETFLIEEGKLTSAQATPLFVRRAGGSAFVFAFAERYSFLYGFCAVLIALCAGIVANRLFARP